MTKAQVIVRLCQLVAKVWCELDQKSETASDCFCEQESHYGSFKHEGLAIEFIEKVVSAALVDRASMEGAK